MGSFFVSLFILKIGVNFVNVVKLCPIFSSTSEETEDEDLPSSPASSSTSSTWLGNVTLAWQEKLFSPCEENYYHRAKEEDFQGSMSTLEEFCHFLRKSIPKPEGLIY